MLINFAESLERKSPIKKAKIAEIIIVIKIIVKSER